MDAAELLSKYAAGECAFRRADLSGANLYGANLSRANLSGADLSGATIDGDRTLTGELETFAPSPHGYAFVCLAVEGGDKWFVVAGCRRFTLAEAVAHWSDDPRLDGAIERWVLPRLALLEGPEND